MSTLLSYERLNEPTLLRSIRLQPGEHLLVLQPFGWHLDGKHIPNMPEQFEREYVCEQLGMEVATEYGAYIAIVRAIGAAAEPSKPLKLIYSRENAHATFNGGYSDDHARSAFHHGMDTVFNLIESGNVARPDVKAALKEEMKVEYERGWSDALLALAAGLKKIITPASLDEFIAVVNQGKNQTS